MSSAGVASNCLIVSLIRLARVEAEWASIDQEQSKESRLAASSVNRVLKNRIPTA